MKHISILSALLFLTACQQYLSRSDFIDPSTGNAKTSNGVLQVIDPWQPYVYDTNLGTSSSRQVIAREKYENGGELPKSGNGQMTTIPQALYPMPAQDNIQAPDNNVSTAFQP